MDNFFKFKLNLKLKKGKIEKTFARNISENEYLKDLLEVQHENFNKEEAKKVTLGSGKRLMFKCTFKNCSAEHKSRAVKDVVKQYRKHNHCYFNDCHHK